MWLLQEIEGEKRKKVFSNKEKNSILNYWHSSSTQQESFEVGWSRKWIFLLTRNS
jgi:hypothetical protein